MNDNNHNQYDYPQNESNAKGIVSMVMGILSMVMCCCYYIALPLGIAAVIFGINSFRQREPQNSFAIIGIGTGIIACLIVIMFIAMEIILYQSGVSQQIMEALKRKIESMQQQMR